MTRESADAKARRYLLEGRVIVKQAGPRRVAAIVRGSGYLWPVKFDDRGWSCPCPSKRCSHVLAVQTVTAPGEPT